MQLKVKRLEMSGSGKKVMWAITDEKGAEIFKTKTGRLAWATRKEATFIIDQVNKNGFEFVAKKLGLNEVYVCG